MSRAELTASLTVNPKTFDTMKSAQDWFKAFASLSDERSSDALLFQMSRMDLSRSQLLHLAEGAREVLHQTACTHPLTFSESTINPDNVVESARLYLRVIERFREAGDQLALSQIGGQREAPIPFLTSALIRLQQMGHVNEASQMLGYMSESSAALSHGVPQLPNRGV